MSSVQSGPAAPGHSVALSVLNLHAQPGRLAPLGVHDHHVGDVDRALLFNHTADLLGPLRTGPLLALLMALDDVEAFHEEPVLGRLHPEHAALLAAILAAHHDDLVAGLDAR